MVYAYYQKGNKDLQVAENELMLSLRRSYDLYHYFLLMIVEVTRMYERLIEMRRNKYRPTEKEKNPDMRMLNNRLAALIAENGALRKYSADHGISWSSDRDFIRKILDMIIQSDTYRDYLTEEDSYQADRDFWQHVFRRIISKNEFVDDFLEEKSIYWNEDIDIVESFVIKTIRRFEENAGSGQDLIPMFNNDDDYDFVINLFRQTILHGEEYRERINRHLNNWDPDRVANMDLVIMQVALAEIMHFPTIPTKVTFNEYIDAARYYSTPKSGIFINGVLDAIIEELRMEKLLTKN
jgi:N utilization substance protein B